MGHTYTALYYHVVFGTKDRLPSIQAEVHMRLYEYFSGIVRGENGSLLAIGGMPDHIHLPTSVTRPRQDKMTMGCSVGS